MDNTGVIFRRIKVISLGSNACGKSCLIKRFCEERFVSKYIPTIGVDYGVKPLQIRDMQVKVNFWDLSGHPEFVDIRNEFYKDTQACILVYDMSSRTSFSELDEWLAEAEKYGVQLQDIPIVLCANKSDKKRAVSEEDGRTYAINKGMKYYETSAMTELALSIGQFVRAELGSDSDHLGLKMQMHSNQSFTEN